MQNDYDALLKHLDDVESRLFRHMVRGTIKAVQDSPEHARAHVVALLQALQHLDPDVLQGHEIPAELEQDGPDGWESRVKRNMAADGQYYYGSLRKHYFGEIGSGPGNKDVRGYGPMGIPGPKKVPHSEKVPQKVHGRGSGKRTLMELAAAYHKLHPDADIPSWDEMKLMSHEDLILLADKHGFLVETRGGTLNVVDVEGKKLKVRARDVSGHVSSPFRGAGNNLDQHKALSALVHILRENGEVLPSKTPIKDKKSRLGVHGPAADEGSHGHAKGQKAYGSSDPHGTLPDQPHMNAGKASSQKLSQKLKNKLKRLKSPKVKQSDLKPVDVESVKGKMKQKEITQAISDAASQVQETKDKIKDKVAVGANGASGKPTNSESHAGEKGPGKDTPEVSGWDDLDGAADRILKVVQGLGEGDGATFGGKTLNKLDLKTGFMASHKGSENKVGHPTKADVVEYLKKHKGAIQKDNLGIWIDGGEVYFDVSRIFSNRPAAEKFGIANGQKAIYSWGSEQVISLDPANVAPDKPKEEPKGGEQEAPKVDGPIPDYSDENLTVTGSAGGSNGAKIATNEEGKKFLVKTYGGDMDRVATELVSNAIYRALAVNTPKAGTHTKDGKTSLAYPMVDGVTRAINEPNAELGKGYMADALLGNWDFIGAADDNILWDGDSPIRVDQGGTLFYRAQGGSKHFGLIPQEVGSLMLGADGKPGQAKGKVLVTEFQLKNQAQHIADTLTSSKIIEIVNAAPFADEGMAQDVKAALAGRVQWMRSLADGTIDLPSVLKNALSPGSSEDKPEDKSPEPNWSEIPDVKVKNEPSRDTLEKMAAEVGKKVSTGMVVIEDGKFWVIEPKDHFGGYKHTFPKGNLEPDLSPQQNAHKEVWEESGLQAEVTQWIGVFEGDTSITSYYLATRNGGAPTNGAETQGVKLVTAEEAAKLLNVQRDKALLDKAIALAEDAPAPAGDNVITGVSGPRLRLAETAAKVTKALKGKFAAAQKAVDKLDDTSKSKPKLQAILDNPNSIVQTDVKDQLAAAINHTSTRVPIAGRAVQSFITQWIAAGSPSVSSLHPPTEEEIAATKAKMAEAGKAKSRTSRIVQQVKDMTLAEKEAKLDELAARLGELSGKSKLGTLTADEKSEAKKLRTRIKNLKFHLQDAHPETWGVAGSAEDLAARARNAKDRAARAVASAPKKKDVENRVKKFSKMSEAEVAKKLRKMQDQAIQLYWDAIDITSKPGGVLTDAMVTREENLRADSAAAITVLKDKYGYSKGKIDNIRRAAVRGNERSKGVVGFTGQNWDEALQDEEGIDHASSIQKNLDWPLYKDFTGHRYDILNAVKTLVGKAKEKGKFLSSRDVLLPQNLSPGDEKTTGLKKWKDVVEHIDSQGVTTKPLILTRGASKDDVFGFHINDIVEGADIFENSPTNGSIEKYGNKSFRKNPVMIEFYVPAGTKLIDFNTQSGNPGLKSWGEGSFHFAYENEVYLEAGLMGRVILKKTNNGDVGVWDETATHVRIELHNSSISHDAGMKLFQRARELRATKAKEAAKEQKAKEKEAKQKQKAQAAMLNGETKKSDETSVQDIIAKIQRKAKK